MQLDSLQHLVRPRVFDSRSDSNEPVLLDDVIGALLERGVRGRISLTGPPGAGKTVALQCLKRTFAGRTELRLVDDTQQYPGEIRSPGELVVRATAVAGAPEDIAQLRLAPWGRDEVIEYLLSNHRARCAELLQRFESGQSALSANGNPELICITLDEMALHADVSDVAMAIRRRFESATPDASERARIRSECLLRQLGPHVGSSTTSALLRLSAARNVLGADAFVEELETGSTWAGLEFPISSELRYAMLTALQSSPNAVGRLESFADDSNGRLARNAIELINGVDARAIANWIASRASRSLPLPQLSRLRLPCVDLEDLVLHDLVADSSLLIEANLSCCDLRRAHLNRATLDRANARGSVLRHSTANGARFVRADLRECDAESVQWDSATLNEADLRNAKFWRASLRFASFDSADLTGSDFSAADLTHATFESATLCNVNFRAARLDDVKLRLAKLANCNFASASLRNCSLDGVVLDRTNFAKADLRGASMTGSRMRGSRFESACLDSTKLADVDWEGADLRDADLTHASFHMGSSRSGLVFDVAPMEGSRTGFYSDEFQHAGYKAPEEIRKANLCRADLRGALVFDTDFYLVDVRGARYDTRQSEHFRRCGAILDGWGKR